MFNGRFEIGSSAAMLLALAAIKLGLVASYPYSRSHRGGVINYALLWW